MNKPGPFLRKTRKITLWTIDWWIPYIKKNHWSNKIRCDSRSNQFKLHGNFLNKGYNYFLIWLYFCLGSGWKFKEGDRIKGYGYCFLFTRILPSDGLGGGGLGKSEFKGERPFLGNMLHIIGSRLRQKVILWASPLFVGPGGLGWDGGFFHTLHRPPLST